MNKPYFPKHTAFKCDVCGRVPTPHEFGTNMGHFVLLELLPSGKFGLKDAEKGKPMIHWTFVNLAARIPKNKAAVCRSCLINPKD